MFFFKKKIKQKLCKFYIKYKKIFYFFNYLFLGTKFEKSIALKYIPFVMPQCILNRNLSLYFLTNMLILQLSEGTDSVFRNLFQKFWNIVVKYIKITINQLFHNIYEYIVEFREFSISNYSHF